MICKPNHSHYTHSKLNRLYTNTLTKHKQYQIVSLKIYNINQTAENDINQITALKIDTTNSSFLFIFGFCHRFAWTFIFQ